MDAVSCPLYSHSSSYTDEPSTQSLIPCTRSHTLRVETRALANDRQALGASIEAHNQFLLHAPVGYKLKVLLLHTIISYDVEAHNVFRKCLFNTSTQNASLITDHRLGRCRDLQKCNRLSLQQTHACCNASGPTAYVRVPTLLLAILACLCRLSSILG